jgi:mercuric ion transport protein
MKWKSPILVLVSSVFSAIAASLCCLGPIAILLLGASGAVGATWFAKWRLPFLGVTIILLGCSWYLALQARRQERCENCVCASSRFGGRNNLVLCVATVFVIGTTTFPMWVNAIVQPIALCFRPAEKPTASPDATLNVKIPSMDCPACAIPIRLKLFQQPGIRNVVVTFKTKEAEVQYDPALVSSRQIISKINETGFRVEPTTPRKSP